MKQKLKEIKEKYNNSKIPTIVMMIFWALLILCLELIPSGYHFYFHGIDFNNLFAVIMCLFFIFILIYIPIKLFKMYKYDYPEVPLGFTIVGVLILFIIVGYISYGSIIKSVKSSNYEITSPDGEYTVVIQSEWEKGEYDIQFCKKKNAFFTELYHNIDSDRIFEKDKFTVEWSGDSVVVTMSPGEKNQYIIPLKFER